MIKKRTLIMAASIACFTGCIGDFWFTFLLADYNPGYSHLFQTMSMLGTANSPVAEISRHGGLSLAF
jgi:hypothetical protein